MCRARHTLTRRIFGSVLPRQRHLGAEISELLDAGRVGARVRSIERSGKAGGLSKMDTAASNTGCRKNVYALAGRAKSTPRYRSETGRISGMQINSIASAIPSVVIPHSRGDTRW